MCVNGRVVKAIDLRSIDCKIAWVRTPLDTFFYLKFLHLFSSFIYFLNFLNYLKSLKHKMYKIKIKHYNIKIHKPVY